MTKISSNFTALNNAITQKTVVTVGTSAGADYVTTNYASDGLAILAAIDAINAAGGGTVFIKKGTYNIAAQMERDVSNITIVGEGIGKTILKHANGNAWILFLGNSGGPTVRENITVKGITFDLNSKALTWGLGISWVKNVLVEDCSIINPSTTTFSMLLVGKFGGASDLWEARNITLRNCHVDGNNVVNTWEMVTVDYARDVVIEGCHFKNQGGPTGLLNYVSENVTTQGCTFNKCRYSLGGRGPNTITGCTFENSELFLWNSENVTVSGNTFNGFGNIAGAGRTCGISLQGSYQLSGGETAFYVTAPYTWNNRNIIINANTFNRCSTNAIISTTITDNAVLVLNSYDLTITNNVFRKSYGNGINVLAYYLNISNNFFIDNNEANIGATGSNILCAGTYVTISGNTSVDSAGTITDDIRINRVEYNAVLPTAYLKIHNNTLLGGTYPIRYWDSAAYTETIQSGITLEANNNKGMNPGELYAQGNVTGATSFDRVNGDVITATLTGNITVTLTNGKVKGDELTLILTQDATGSRTVTWPSNFKKAGGTLTLSVGASAVDIVKMRWDGTNWREVSRSLNLS